MACHGVKGALGKARTEAHGQLQENMNENEEGKEGSIPSAARQKDRVSKDTQPVRVIKDAEGNTQVESEDILRGWKEYFIELMNGSNEKAS